MERLKEVRPWPKAVPPKAAGRGGQTWPKGSMGSSAPPFLLHPSLLSVHLSVCPLSACHAPPICLSTCPSVPPQLLIVLSLSQSLERQLWAVLVPLVALRFRLLLLSLQGLLLEARAKVRAGGGEPSGPCQGGQVAVPGASRLAEGACSEGMGLHRLRAGVKSPWRPCGHQPSSGRCGMMGGHCLPR